MEVERRNSRWFPHIWILNSSVTVLLAINIEPKCRRETLTVVNYLSEIRHRRLHSPRRSNAFSHFHPAWVKYRINIYDLFLPIPGNQRSTEHGIFTRYLTRWNFNFRSTQRGFQFQSRFLGNRYLFESTIVILLVWNYRAETDALRTLQCWDNIERDKYKFWNFTENFQLNEEEF